MDNYVFSEDRAVYGLWFEELEVQLRLRNRNQGFKTSTNEVRRDVEANEFMYMCHRKDMKQIQFKHHNTRNYVYLVDEGNGWILVVPETSTPFNQGEFDKENLKYGT